VIRHTRTVKRLLIIGIGAGDPEHVTMQAVRALNEADVLFVMDKGDDKADLVRLRQEICDRYIAGPYRMVATADPPRLLDGPSYEDDVRAWHEQRVTIYERLIAAEIPPGGTGAFLVWGDPSLYDSTLRFVDSILARDAVAFEVEVIPGISAVQVLAAQHRITLHGVGEPVHITTGRRLADSMAALDDGDVVVMLDGRCAFTAIDPTDVDIYWGAYLGTDDEILVSGPLAAVADDIVRRRAEAKAAKHWMFDTYLLRRRRTSPS
jgi:precorrin-6A synthase